MAFNGTQGFEAWTERRRLGVTDWFNGTSNSVFARSSTSTLPGNAYPLRLVFPSTERSSNPNAPTVTDIDVPVWWAN